MNGRSPARAAAVAGAFSLAVAAAACASRDGATAGGATTAPATTAATAPAAGRPYRYDARTETFVDRSRPTVGPDGATLAAERTLATELYLPEGDGPFPLVVFAHGNSGHPRRFTQLLGAWAEAGYVVAAPAFPLTNDDARPASVGDVAQQPADVSFVVGEVLALAAPGGPLAGRVDAERVGVAGLSLGAVTVYGVTFHSCCRDERVDAAIVMAGARLPFEGVYDFRSVPLLVVHGTADPTIPYREAEAAYEGAAPPKHLVTLVGGVHSAPFEDDPSPHDDVVTRVTVDFLDAYLLGDAAAARRIAVDGTVTGVARAVSAHAPA